MTGFTPVDAFSRAAVMVTGQPDPLRPANALNPQVPQRVADVLMQAMSQAREQRPASVSEMRWMLRAAVNDQPTEIAPVTPEMVATLPIASEPRTDSSPSIITRPLPIANPTAMPEAQSNELAPRTEGEALQLSPATLPHTAHATEAASFPELARKRHRWLWMALGIIALLIGAVVFVVMRGKQAKAAEPVMKSYNFDMVTVDAKGKETNRRRRQARYYTEDLGGGVTLDMVDIPDGTFLMGSPANDDDYSQDKRPQHQVRVSAFYMGKFEVTQAQWRAVASLPKVNRDLNPDPSHFKGDNLPVENVSWEDATEFCKRLSKVTGRTYRLPTEAEWEYACRAGTTTPFAFGETITPQLANYDGDDPDANAPKGLYRKETVPVGSLGVANGFGLFDMHGNVAEWCRDWYSSDYYSLSPNADPTGPSTGSERVSRGGGWLHVMLGVRSVFRIYCPPDSSRDDLGFRLVRTDR